jgi:hypothetical protein
MRELPHREIETINIPRQAGRIDRASGRTANDPERIGSTSWKNPCDGTQYTNLVRRSRTASTHDQRDARSLDVNLVRHGHAVCTSAKRDLLWDESNNRCSVD